MKEKTIKGDVSERRIKLVTIREIIASVYQKEADAPFVESSIFLEFFCLSFYLMTDMIIDVKNEDFRYISYRNTRK